MPKAVPLRSCVACRTNLVKGELLRYVLSPDGEVVPDLQQKLPGRGAYTCLKAGCLTQAVKKRQLARALGATGEIDAVRLVSRVRERFEERIAGYISLANKGGKLVSGSDRVLEQLKKGNTGLLIMAADISPDSADKFQGAAQAHHVPVAVLFDKERLGGLIGKELRSVLAVLDSGFIGPMTLEMDRYRNFLEEERQ
ncbi:DUF448 domain-containing protein [Geomesophilobacter sediminis]|uniref:DUF448 domain-containing protein n=1 Tax=Geomesophilobacter sediminis TaxID=2798584 RepID=A0A8J7S9F2_9BACT|nr:DUF448 domain-containing protein [Geomesophilobacter sediminis]MBJ6726745.1 DUF448 domain-containing protein [Geomesophilobacter sediminis]